MQDEMIVDLYWKRDESAISETERKYGRYLSKIAYNMFINYCTTTSVLSQHVPANLGQLASLCDVTSVPAFPLYHSL